MINNPKKWQNNAEAISINHLSNFFTDILSILTEMFNYIANI
jgi:hypothetical protein